MYFERLNDLRDLVDVEDMEMFILENISENYGLDDLIYDYHDYELFIHNQKNNIGIELELTYVDMIDLISAGLNGYVNLEIMEDDEAPVTASYDSSIFADDGVEFVTDANTPREVLNSIRDILDNINCEESQGAGMHIHFNKDYWNYNSTEMNKFIIICSIWRRFLQNISNRDYEEWEEWSQTNIKTKYGATQILKSNWFENDFPHGSLINTEHGETIEYRGFSTTTDFKLIESRVYLILDLIKYVKSLSYDDVYSIINNEDISNIYLKSFIERFTNNNNNTKVLNSCRFVETDTIAHKQLCQLKNTETIEKIVYNNNIFRPEK